MQDASKAEASGCPPEATSLAADATARHRASMPLCDVISKRLRFTAQFMPTTSTDPTASARSLTGSCSAVTGTASMNA